MGGKESAGGVGAISCFARLLCAALLALQAPSSRSDTAPFAIAPSKAQRRQNAA